MRQHKERSLKRMLLSRYQHFVNCSLLLRFLIFTILPFLSVSFLQPKRSVKELYLSNRYLIYTLTGWGYYMIYDFFQKQLITNRRLIMSLLNHRNERREPWPVKYTWHGNDKLFVYEHRCCNLWDIQKNRMYYVHFELQV